MNIKLFERSNGFFDINENEEEFNEEKGCQEISDEEEDICGCNLCNLIRHIFLFINRIIYKNLNGNKVD